MIPETSVICSDLSRLFFAEYPPTREARPEYQLLRKESW